MMMPQLSDRRIEHVDTSNAEKANPPVHVRSKSKFSEQEQMLALAFFSQNFDTTD